MTEAEVHLLLSKVVIDNDNLDYIKATGEICGKLRLDLVKLFAIPVVIKSVCDVCGSDEIIEAPHMGKNCNRCHPI